MTVSTTVECITVELLSVAQQHTTVMRTFRPPDSIVKCGKLHKDVINCRRLLSARL